MSVNSVVYVAITGNVTAAALIGTRCYPVRLTDNQTLPACAFTIIDDVQNASEGQYRARVQIDCYASSHAGLVTLREAIQGVIDSQLWALSGWGSEIYDDVGIYYFQSVDVFIEHE